MANARGDTFADRMFVIVLIFYRFLDVVSRVAFEYLPLPFMV